MLATEDTMREAMWSNGDWRSLRLEQGEGAMLTALWPVARLGDALETLSRRSGLTSRESTQIPVPPASLADDRRSLGKWIEETATMFGFEAESFEMTCGELGQEFRSAGPALLEMPDQGFFTLLENGFVLGPDHKVRRRRPSAIRKMMCAEKEAAAADEIEFCSPSRRDSTTAPGANSLCHAPRTHGPHSHRPMLAFAYSSW